MAEYDYGFNTLLEFTQATFPVDRGTLIYPKDASIMAAISAVIFVALGCVGNALTIAALIKCPKLNKQATTWFVVSLSISDIIFCAFNLPLTATRFIFEAWIFGDVLCKLFPFLFYANFGASLFHIMLIAINRYMLISNYVRYEKIYKPFHVIAMIWAVWIFSFLLLLPPLLDIWGTMGLDPDTYSCTILKKDGMSPKKFLFLFGILPPFVIVVYCYTQILWSVRQSKQILRRIQEATGIALSTSASKKDELKLTKTMILLFFCFVTCFIPLMIVNVVDEKISYPSFHVFASILAWSSAVINPIIYCVSSKSYRHAYAKLLGLNKDPANNKEATPRAARSNTSETTAV